MKLDNHHAIIMSFSLSKTDEALNVYTRTSTSIRGRGIFAYLHLPLLACLHICIVTFDPTGVFSYLQLTLLVFKSS